MSFSLLRRWGLGELPCGKQNPRNSKTTPANVTRPWRPRIFTIALFSRRRREVSIFFWKRNGAAWGKGSRNEILDEPICQYYGGRFGSVWMQPGSLMPMRNILLPRYLMVSMWCQLVCVWSWTCTGNAGKNWAHSQELLQEKKSPTIHGSNMMLLWMLIPRGRVS